MKHNKGYLGLFLGLFFILGNILIYSLSHVPPCLSELRRASSGKISEDFRSCVQSCHNETQRESWKNYQRFNNPAGGGGVTELSTFRVLNLRVRHS